MDNEVIDGVVASFSAEEKAMYQSFTEQEKEHFKVGISIMLSLTDLPGRLILSSAKNRYPDTHKLRWVIDFIIGLKPDTRNIAEFQINAGVKKPKTFRVYRLYKNYANIAAGIRGQAFTF